MAIALLLLSGALIDVTQAQTPVPSTVPKLTLQWLAGLSLSKSDVPLGANVVGTVTLLRPALSNLRVTLSMVGAAPILSGSGSLSAVGFRIAPNAQSSFDITIPAGHDRATFGIDTSGALANIPIQGYGIEARYGSEFRSVVLVVRGFLEQPQPPRP